MKHIRVRPLALEIRVVGMVIDGFVVREPEPQSDERQVLALHNFVVTALL